METVKTVSSPWDLDTYFGRWMYYSWITNPKLNFVTSSMIEEAKLIRFSYLYGHILFFQKINLFVHLNNA